MTNPSQKLILPLESLSPWNGPTPTWKASCPYASAHVHCVADDWNLSLLPVALGTACPIDLPHHQEVQHHPTDRFAPSVPVVALQPKTLFWGMPLYLGDLPLTMGKVILTTDTQHMEAISATGGNSWSLVTHMNEVSLGDTVRGEALSVGVNVCASWMCLMCVRGSPVILLLTAKSSHSSLPFM